MEELRNITYAQAICEAQDEEMTRDENIILLGEEVAAAGGVWRTSAGLLEKYGEWRVRDTPISEEGFTGLGIGAAIMGGRPIIELMGIDFAPVCFDMILNNMSKYRYMTGGQVKVPMVVRMPMGGGRSSGANHSQSLHALFAHITGLKVVVPSTAAEAKGLLKTAIRDDDPVVFIEGRTEYSKKHKVPEGEYTIPFGKSNVVREGSDITIVTCGAILMRAEKAAKKLEEESISAELVDLRTLIPLDTDTISESVKKTGRLLIVDDANESFGITGEIAFRVMQSAMNDLKNPVERLCFPDVPVPFSPGLEFPIMVDAKKIVERVKEMVK